jgi:hypothetical protein
MREYTFVNIRVRPEKNFRAILAQAKTAIVDAIPAESRARQLWRSRFLFRDA